MVKNSIWVSMTLNFTIFIQPAFCPTAEQTLYFFSFTRLYFWPIPAILSENGPDHPVQPSYKTTHKKYILC